ncbi:MAG: PAS domain-containing protein, partial [Nitrospira sp.]|nr:PAS domain-containing protein [Nitrospira sp.]
MANGARVMMAWLQGWLPRGVGLTEASWVKRHRGLTVFLWCHVVGLPILGLLFGNSLLMSVSSVAAIGCCAILAGIQGFPSRVRSAIMGVGLALSSSVLVHLSGGYIEMHFHYFVILPLLMLYQDWVPFLVSAVFIAGHHLLAGLWFSHSVFNHPEALAHPWQWAGVHVLFFGAASVAYLVTWRSAERHVEALRATEEQLRQSEAFLDSVIEHLPNLVFVKEADSLRHIRFNAACEQLLGVSRQEVLGKNNYDFFPAELADLYTAKDRDVLTSGRMIDIPEEPIQTKDKGLRFLHTKKVSICDADGVPRYLLGISEDITERKEAEGRLRQSEAFLDSDIENLPSMVFVKDAKDLRFVRFNKAGEELLGRSRESLLGKNDYDLFSKEQADFFMEKDRAVMAARRMLD